MLESTSWLITYLSCFIFLHHYRCWCQDRIGLIGWLFLTSKGLSSSCQLNSQPDWHVHTHPHGEIKQISQILLLVKRRDRICVFLRQYHHLRNYSFQCIICNYGYKINFSNDLSLLPFRSEGDLFEDNAKVLICPSCYSSLVCLLMQYLFTNVAISSRALKKRPARKLRNKLQPCLQVE